MDEIRRVRWERAAEWPLTVLAALFLAGYAWPILVPDLDSRWVALCTLITTVAWVAFGADYAIRLLLSTRRWRFVRTHMVDLAVVVLPFLRPLRLLRLVTLLTC